jgi:hypothetical protein
VKLLCGHTGKALREITRLEKEDDKLKEMVAKHNHERILRLGEVAELPRCTVCYDGPAV